MTAGSVRIVLQWPDSRLMPNRKNGRHWGGTQAAKVRARQDGYFEAKAALGRTSIVLGDRLPVRITFVAPDRRQRDLDNLLACIKPQLDGIAQALGVDDSRFRPVTIDDAVDQQKRGFVLVEISDE